MKRNCPTVWILWTYLWLCSGVALYGATDTIPPTITTQASDLSIECDEGVLDALTDWYNDFGGLTATDATPVELRALLTSTEVVQRLEIDQGIQCGTTGSVEVGFYAADTCGNFSDTSFATFTITDTEGPEYLRDPDDVTVQCSAAAGDTLTEWVRTFANAVIDDECSVTQRFVRYTWTDSEGNSGSQDYDQGVDITLMNTQCNYTMTVTFVAVDECDNESSRSAIFTLEDNARPVFEGSLADTIVVTCDDVPSARSVNVTDGCDGTIIPTITDVSTQDPDENTCEHYNYQISRVYTATDRCGNEATITQLIFVADTLEPRYLAPNDTTITNVAIPDPSVSGEPIDVIDNCSSQVLTDYIDQMIANGCTLTINRRWNIQDQCGSSLVLSQRITVVDEIPPTAVVPPSDQTLSCTTRENVNVLFNAWVSNFGGAQVVDQSGVIISSFAAVPGSYDTEDQSTWPGQAPGTLDAAACPSDRPGLAQYEDVDFVYIDACGNALVLTATFGIEDTSDPVINNMPADTTIVVDGAGNCEATYTVAPLDVSDNCAGGEAVSISATPVEITGSSDLAPVDNITLSLGPVTATDFGTEMITVTFFLFNVDADNPTEYFNIFGEDNTFIGRTANATAQCGSVTTELQITPAQMAAWSADGMVDFRLRTNIVTGVPSFSINDVCNNSSASARILLSSSLRYDVKQYLINDDGQLISIGDSTDITLQAGDNTLRYRVIDCANNTTDITQNVRVIGDMTGGLNCGQDSIITLPVGQCMTDVTLPSGTDAATECGISLSVQSVEVTGATTISSDDIDLSGETFSVSLDKGINQIVYTLSDGIGGTSQCITTVTVIDDESPMISCAPMAFGRLHPSGILPLVIDTATVLLSAEDNCEVARIDFENTDVSCDFVGEEIRFVIRVTDGSGNVTQCNSTLRIVPLPLEPTADPVLCFGDTIRLSANAPIIDDMSIYSYSWTGPNGFSSTEANPRIPDASISNSGTYSITVSGMNGCSSQGSVDVVITDFTAPSLTVSASGICTGDSITLTTDDLGSSINYEWYESSVAPNNLISNTNTPTLNIAPSSGDHQYIIRVSSDACPEAFEPSEAVTVMVADRPNFTIADTLINLCIGDTVQLAASTSDSDVTYIWAGPNDYASTQIVPAPFIGQRSQAGIYTLYATRGTCIDSAQIEVRIGGDLEKAIVEAQPSYCENSDFAFTIQNYDVATHPGLQYRWIKNGAFFATTLTDTLPIFSASQDAHGGDWQVIVQGGECDTDTSDVFNIVIVGRLDIEISHPDSVCDGDSIRLGIPEIEGASYQWSGPRGFNSTDRNTVAPSIGGVYSVDITRVEGCTETYSARVRVDQSPIILSLLSNAQECSDGVGNLLVTISSFPDNNVTYQWTGPNGFSSDMERLIVQDYSAADNGTYQLIVSQGNCPSEPATLDLNVTDVPDPPIISSVASICLTETAIIAIDTSAVTDITSYTWITPNGQVTTTTPFLQIDNVSQNDGGLYFVSASRGNCTSEFSDTIQLSVFSTPDAPVIESNSPLCMGEELTLRVAPQNNTTYEWEGPDGFVSDKNEITITNATAAIEGQYRVRIRRNGCPSEYTVLESVGFADSPRPPVLETGDTDVCQSNISDLELCIDRDSFMTGVTYQWYNNTTGQTIGTTTDVCFKVTSMAALAPGLNTVVARAMIDDCPSPDSRPIIIDLFGIPDLTARVGDDIRTCETENITIKAIEPLRGRGEWRAVDPMVVISNPNDAVTQVFGLSEGENIFIWSLSNGSCDNYSSAQLKVTVASTVIAVDDDYDISYNVTTPLDIVDNDDVSGEYTIEVITQPERGSAFYDTLQDALVYTADPRYLGDVTLEYEICDTQCGELCSTASVTITIGEADACFGPNIITPNGDGINDRVVFPCVADGSRPQNSFAVYSERGDELFSQSPYDNTWAGTYNGRPLPNGTYFYVFSPGDGEEPIKSYLIIHR